MVYNIPELDGSGFFEVAYGGKVYRLPKMASVTFEQMRLVEAMSGGVDDLTGVVQLFESLAPEFAEEVLPRLTPGQLGPLIAEWQSDSGISSGESSASSGS